MRYTILMIVERIEKTCPVCQTAFTVPPSLDRLVCCSRACSATHRSAKRTLTCPQCSKEFQVSPGSKQQYCSRECGQTSRRGKPHTNRRRIEKVCPVCGTTFEVTPSTEHVVCCSKECGYKQRASRPRSFTPETHARLRGRPKKAADTERECPSCGDSFTVPEWNPKVYCSVPCAHEARTGRRRGDPDRKEKICPVCATKFYVSPSRERLTCCSTKCAGLLKRDAAMENVRQMTEGECMWFAGLFDGEGSVTLSNRRLPGGGTVVISLVNTCEPLMVRLREVVGAGPLHFNEVSAGNPRHNDTWTWQLCGAAALEVLRQVRPWLIVKAERADAVLAGETFPRQSRWDSVYPEV